MASTRPRTSGWAVASLVMGILGWTCLFFIGSVLAIVFGAVAKSQIRKGEGQVRGNGMATAGLVLGIVLVAILVISALIVVPLSLVSVGPTRTVVRTVEQGAAAVVNADLEVRNGSLDVRGGARELMRGAFTYNVSDWRPDVDYRVADGRGALSVRQKGGWHWAIWKVRNDWKIEFKDGVPIDLHSSMSAGGSHYDLNSLDLTGLDLSSNAGSITADVSGDKPSLRNTSVKTNAGRVALEMTGIYSSPLRLDVRADAGSIDLDLAGTWRASVNGTVETSAGTVTIRLPRDVGVSVNADSSFGTVEAPGLKRGFSAKTYVNEAYGNTAVTIELDVRSSAGTVRLELAP